MIIGSDISNTRINCRILLLYTISIGILFNIYKILLAVYIMRAYLKRLWNVLNIIKLLHLLTLHFWLSKLLQLLLLLFLQFVYNTIIKLLIVQLHFNLIIRRIRWFSYFLLDLIFLSSDDIVDVLSALSYVPYSPVIVCKHQWHVSSFFISFLYSLKHCIQVWKWNFCIVFFTIFIILRIQ